jgi:hypothetical protein
MPGKLQHALLFARDIVVAHYLVEGWEIVTL